MEKANRRSSSDTTSCIAQPVMTYRATVLLLLLLLLLLSPVCGQVSDVPMLPAPNGPPRLSSGDGSDSTPCILSQPSYSCCGRLEYDAFKATCCGGFLVVGRRFAACCGRDAFDADLQGCCNGLVVNRTSFRGPLACCGAAGYDPTTHECCGTTVIHRSPVMACCGGKPYFFPEPIGPTPSGAAERTVGESGSAGPPGSPSSSPTATVCCGCRLYNVSTNIGQASCCGDAPHDTAKQLCCNGVLHNVAGKQEPRCCGAVLVDDTSSTSCCQGRPYTYGMYGPLCCADGRLGSCCYVPSRNQTVCI